MKIKEITNVLETILPGSDISEGDIYFEKLSMSGLKEMHAYSTDKRLYEFFEMNPFKTIDDTRNYINKQLTERMSYDGEQKRGMCWFVRRIHIFQFQECLKKYVFEKLLFNRIYGNSFITNKRAISSLLSTGMKEEGIARQHYFKYGKYIDSWMYSMLREDYLNSKISYNNKSHLISDKKIIEIISRVLENEDININSTMLNTDNWDSLNHMHIIVMLKEELKIDFSPKDIAKLISVKSILDFIKV